MANEFSHLAQCWLHFYGSVAVGDHPETGSQAQEHGSCASKGLAPVFQDGVGGEAIIQPGALRKGAPVKRLAGEKAFSHGEES